MKVIWRKSKTKEEIINSDQKQTREFNLKKHKTTNKTKNQKMDGKNMPERELNA